MLVLASDHLKPNICPDPALLLSLIRRVSPLAHSLPSALLLSCGSLVDGASLSAPEILELELELEAELELELTLLAELELELLELELLELDAITLIEKGGSDTDALPSLT